MTPEDLRELISHWEGPHVDFKRSIGSQVDLAKDLVCFANGDGGQLIIGVSEERRIVGVPDADDVMIRTDQAAFQRCSPPVPAASETVRVDGETVVVVTIARGDQRPYATKDGRYYIRSGSRCRTASREELLRLFQATSSLFYDEQPIGGLTLGALDLDAVSRYASDVLNADPQDVDVPSLLKDWRLSDGSHPTVGGLVLFGRRPQAELESARVVVAAFAGTDSGDDLVDRKDISGGLFQVIDAVAAFLRLHLPVAHKIVGFEPERRVALPEAALREAVVNAVVHRDYTIPGPTRIFVFADRVEVHSPGRPPNTVDADAMRAGAHVTRNPHIYSRVADAELATRAGTGVRRIARLLRDSGGSSLGIDISDAEVVLSLPRLR